MSLPCRPPDTTLDFSLEVIVSQERLSGEGVAFENLVRLYYVNVTFGVVSVRKHCLQVLALRVGLGPTSTELRTATESRIGPT